MKYEDILPDADLICHIRGSRFKDEFILKSASANPTIQLNLNAEARISFKQDSDGNVFALDGENVVFRMPRATVEDANGEPGIIST